MTPTQVTDTLVRFLVYRWEDDFTVGFDESLRFVRLYAALHGVQIDAEGIKRLRRLIATEQAEHEANPAYKRLEEVKV